MKRLRHKLGAATKLQRTPVAYSPGAPQTATLRSGFSAPLPKNREPGIRKPHSHRRCLELRGRERGEPGSEQQPRLRLNRARGAGRMYSRRGWVSPSPALPPRHEGRAEIPPGPDPANLPVVAGRSQLPQVGARGSAGHVPWGPARVPASELLELAWRGRGGG